MHISSIPFHRVTCRLCRSFICRVRPFISRIPEMIRTGQINIWIYNTTIFTPTIKTKIWNCRGVICGKSLHITHIISTGNRIVLIFRIWFNTFRKKQGKITSLLIINRCYILLIIRIFLPFQHKTDIIFISRVTPQCHKFRPYNRFFRCYIHIRTNFINKLYCRFLMQIIQDRERKRMSGHLSDRSRL